MKRVVFINPAQIRLLGFKLTQKQLNCYIYIEKLFIFMCKLRKVDHPFIIRCTKYCITAW